MSYRGGNYGCGAGCKCGIGCGGCRMYPDVEKTATATIIDGVAPSAEATQALCLSEGSEMSFGAEGGHACKCGPNCKCDPCNC